MTSRFGPAREAYFAFAGAVRRDAELAADIQKAFDLLLSRYNTRIYENRFIVGGVAERIIAAVFVEMGHAAQTLGVVVTRTDICVRGVHLSVKGSFRPNTGTIRMVNVMGASTDASWQEPTIFVISGKGIGYADPDHLPGATTRDSDAVKLRTRPLLELWERETDLFVPMPIPYSREDQAGSDVASRIVADEIFRYTTRLKPFDKRHAWE